MPESTTSTRSRIFHEIDFDKPGKQIGYLRVPQSRCSPAATTSIAVMPGR